MTTLSTLTAAAVIAIFALISSQASMPVHQTGLVPSAHAIHPTGFRLNPKAHVNPTALQHLSTVSVPSAVDLSAYDPPIGDQGQVGSCTAWSTTNLRYWIENHDFGVQISPRPSPMLQYAQIVHGQNVGTSFDDNLNLEMREGAESVNSYSLGSYNAEYDYTDQPNAQDAINAAPFKIASWQYLSTTAGPQNEQIIQQALASGTPIILAIHVYEPFEQYRGAGTIAAGGSTYYGDHAIMADGYDSAGNINGPNQWGTGWGRNGRFSLSPSFVASDVIAIVAVQGPKASPTPIPTIKPSPTPVPTLIPFPTPRPTNTGVPPTPAPTVTPRPTPTLTPKPLPTIAPTPLHRNPYSRARWCRYDWPRGLHCPSAYYNHRLTRIAFAWSHWHNAFGGTATLDHVCGGVRKAEAYDRAHNAMTQKFSHCAVSMKLVRGNPMHWSRL